MPGILPMKVIKVGNSSQSRIAQACDRCRSKKIRCDGIRPCCTQCANVGFECRTSDKLSRRAFPRGYTESLEDRVRSLEAEVRDLKELLDQRDEKIEVLSRIRSFAPRVQKCNASQSPGCSSPASDQDVGNVIFIQLSSTTRTKPTADAPFMGPSSTRIFAGMICDLLPGVRPTQLQQ
jgi:Fungal Zn(2)-Cys(6) binuclear cluster domain